jgi:hypothetical protein
MAFIGIAIAIVIMIIAINRITSSLESDEKLGTISDLHSEKRNTEQLLARFERKAWIYGLFVALGIAGEAWYGVRVLTYSRHLRSVQKSLDVQTTTETNTIETQLATAIMEENSTKQRLADAITSLGVANKVAAEAGERAALADERVARLEYQQAQRIIPPQMRVAMIASLSKFKGQHYQIYAQQQEAESKECVIRISEVLLNCGWVRDIEADALPQSGNIIMQGSLLQGDCLLYYNGASSLAAADAYNAFFSAVVFAPGNIPKETVAIVVLPKRADPETLRQIQEQMRRQSPFSVLMEQIASTLRPYRNQVISIYSPPDDPSADIWSGDIFACLSSAGWKLNDFRSHASYMIDFNNAMIGISEADKGSGHIPPGAVALLTVFKELGVVGRTDDLRPMKDVPSGQIIVRLGVYLPTTIRP